MTRFDTSTAECFSNRFVFVVFNLPKTTLTVCHYTGPRGGGTTNKLLLSTTLTYVFANVARPLRFSFLFMTPTLFMIRIVLTNTTCVVTRVLGVTMKLAFSNNFLSLFLFNVLRKGTGAD